VTPPAAAPAATTTAPRAAASTQTAVARRPDVTGLPQTPVIPPPAPAAAATTAADATASAPLPPAAPLPASPASAVAAVQGRAIALIDALLRRGGRAPVRVVPPERKTTYRGPDADLLQLQEDVLSLAIEALGTAPPVAGQKDK
jgi:hypothetical protein